MKDCNLSWSDFKSIASFHEKLNNYEIPIRENDFTKEISRDTEAKCLRIRLRVVDSQNCHGPQGNVTIALPLDLQQEENVSKEQINIRSYLWRLH